MALKKCKECKKEISSKANNCPNCGAPVNQISKAISGCFIKLFVIIILIIAIFYWVSTIPLDSVPNSYSSPSTNSNWKTQDNSYSAYLMMQEFVKKRLKSPSTAKFPNFYLNTDHIKKISNQTYQITSYVDSQNTFGAMIRTKFLVK